MSKHLAVMNDSNSLVEAAKDPNYRASFLTRHNAEWSQSRRDRDTKWQSDTPNGRHRSKQAHRGEPRYELAA